MATTGPIATYTSISAGSGYVSGTYKNVALSGGNGTGAMAHITVAGGVITAVTLPHPGGAAQLERVGKNYQVGDVLGADAGFDAVGGGTGFAVNVGTLANACENCIYGKIVPPSSPLFGQRYCADSAYVNQNTRSFALALLGKQPYQDASVLTSHSYESLICQDDYMCGEGASLATGISFSSTVTSLPTTATPTPGPFAINTQTVNYTFVLGDTANIVEMNLAGANTLTVPPNSTVGFPIGTVLNFTQLGAGVTTITAGAGVTLRNHNGLRTGGQYAAGSLYKDASDTWIVSGDMQV